MYEERLNRTHDFEVRYRFFTPDEGGRESGPPYQGYRSDWSYEGDEIEKTGIYMIWPEFEDDNGIVIKGKEKVRESGVARMWIVNPELVNEVHKKRIKVGVKGFFMEGSRKVAEAEVIRVVGLNQNET